MKIRIIITGNESGTREIVRITEDLSAAAEYFAAPGDTISSDTIITTDAWPDAFPMDYDLIRQ